MEFSYQNRKHIAKFALFSFLLVLLLSLNIKIGGETNSTSNLEIMTVNQSIALNHCLHASNNWENASDPIQIKRLLINSFCGLIVERVLLSFTAFLRINRRNLLWERRDTLVSLSIRKDE